LPIFVRKHFVILDKTHDFQTNKGDFIEQEAAHTDLFMSVALKYQFPIGKPIIPDALWNLIQVNYRKAG
jgi:hypothetical protein